MRRAPRLRGFWRALAAVPGLSATPTAERRLWTPAPNSGLPDVVRNRGSFYATILTIGFAMPSALARPWAMSLAASRVGAMTTMRRWALRQRQTRHRCRACPRSSGVVSGGGRPDAGAEPSIRLTLGPDEALGARGREACGFRDRLSVDHGRLNFFFAGSRIT